MAAPRRAPCRARAPCSEGRRRHRPAARGAANMVAALFAATNSPRPAPMTASATTVRSVRVAEAASSAIPAAVSEHAETGRHARARPGPGSRHRAARTPPARSGSALSSSPTASGPTWSVLSRKKGTATRQPKRTTYEQHRRDDAGDRTPAPGPGRHPPPILVRSAGAAPLRGAGGTARTASAGSIHAGRSRLRRERQRREHGGWDRGEQQGPVRVDAAHRVVVGAPRQEEPARARARSRRSGC